MRLIQKKREAAGLKLILVFEPGCAIGNPLEQIADKS
jgi:hypothetical protein